MALLRRYSFDPLLLLVDAADVVVDDPKVVASFMLLPLSVVDNFFVLWHSLSVPDKPFEYGLPLLEKCG